MPEIKSWGRKWGSRQQNLWDPHRKWWVRGEEIQETQGQGVLGGAGREAETEKTKSKGDNMTTRSEYNQYHTQLACQMNQVLKHACFQSALAPVQGNWSWCKALYWNKLMLSLTKFNLELSQFSFPLVKENTKFQDNTEEKFSQKASNLILAADTQRCLKSLWKESLVIQSANMLFNQFN